MRSRSLAYLSRTPFRTLREFPHGEESINARWLLRAGFISKIAAGIYSFLPLGKRVLEKIEDIVRDEMTTLGSSEILLPALHPRELWDRTGRWDTVDVLFKTSSRSEADYCMGPTHEEVIIPTASSLFSSYRDLPLSLFQIQTKFRDEPRPRSGLLRGREFRMKDMYSFHIEQGDLESYYARATAAYRRIFERAGVGKETVLTFASGGAFSRFSHEFQMMAPSGEDTIYLLPEENIAINKEVATDQEVLKLVFGDSIPVLEECRAIEVGNIFQLGTRFSDPLGLTVTNAAGEKVAPIMGCYGIGTSRLLGAIAELHNDERGLKWPLAVAPYDLHIVVIPGVTGIHDTVERITRDLSKDFDIIVDDRTGIRAGEKFTDADLIGVPLRIVIGKRACDRGELELIRRADGAAVQVPLEGLRSKIIERLGNDGG